jgi:hypothetical protein
MEFGNEETVCILFLSLPLMFQDQIYLDYLRQLKLALDLMINDLMIKKSAGDDDGALSVLDLACRRIVGIPLSLVRRTPPERLLELIKIGGQSNFNSILMAELLLQDVEISKKIGNLPQVIVSQLQAFCLLVDSMPRLGSDEQTEYWKKLDVLASDLESISDPYVRGKVDGYLLTKAQV